MLTFNPHDRITAEQALALPIFDPVRNEKYENDELEPISPSMICLQSEESFSLDDLNELIYSELASGF